MQSIAIGICLNNLINKANQWQKRTPLASGCLLSFNYDDTSTSTCPFILSGVLLLSSFVALLLQLIHC